MGLNLNSKITKLKRDVAKSLRKKAKWSESADSKTRDLQVLEEMQAEVDRISREYSESYKAISKKKRNTKMYLETKRNMFGDDVFKKKKKKDISSIKNDYDGKISALEIEIASKEEKCREAQNEYEKAKEKVEEEQKEYEKLRKKPNTILRKLEELDVTKEKIEEEGTDKKIANMYFLVEELRNTINEYKVDREKDFRAKLIKSWNNRDKVKKIQRNKEKILEKVKSELARKRERLESLKRDRWSRILKKTNKIRS